MSDYVFPKSTQTSLEQSELNDLKKEIKIAKDELIQLRKLVTGFVDGDYGIDTFKKKAKEILTKE